MQSHESRRTVGVQYGSNKQKTVQRIYNKTSIEKEEICIRRRLQLLRLSVLQQIVNYSREKPDQLVLQLESLVAW